MLNLTTKEMIDRTALRVNPCKTCQPVGALYCALGVHNCMPHSHGSQGCVSYHRSFLSRHFKEPAVASTSSFTEGASVFGGGSNLRTAVKNVFAIYNPDIIAVHTTCLSETIGDDVGSYIIEMDVPEDKLVVHASTPSYVGSHVTGFYNMMSGFIKYLAQSTGKKNGKVGIFPGFVNPGDIREMKRIASAMEVPFIMFPDQSGVMDAPMTGRYEMFPSGGTTIEEMTALGDCDKVLALGALTCTEPANTLYRKCDVPYEVLPLPMGLEGTDDFVMALTAVSQHNVAAALEEERGQLVDVMLDAHIYHSGKSVAIFGDPDTVIGLTQLVLEMGMTPKYVITGTPGEAFDKAINEKLFRFGQTGAKVKSSGDLFELHQWIKNEPVDLLLGTSYGKQIAKAENIPFVRAGFPVLDRYAHSYMPVVGYRGAMRMVEMITNALLDHQDRECADEDMDVVM